MSGAPGPIEISFAYTEDEYLSAARLFPYAGKRDARFERGLMLGLFAAMLSIFALVGDPYLWGIVAAIVIPAVSLGYLNGRARVRRAFRRDPKLRDPYAVRFTEGGIGIRSTDFEVRYDWGYYSKVVETSEFLFFIYGEELYFFVPKRALRRERGEEAALRELLRRKFGEKMQTYGLPEAQAHAVEREYVPPREPPDWR